jgi:hypothetical protein
MAKNKWFIPSLVIAGLLFLGLSLYLSTRLEPQAPGVRVLARAGFNSGEVFVLPRGMNEKRPLIKSVSLYYLDSLETGPDGDATLEFDSGFRIRVLDNVLLTLDQDGEKTVVILKHGDVQVEKFGSENSVLISKGGQHYSANEYEVTVRRETSQNTFPELAPEAIPGQNPAAAGENLSSDYIQDTMKRQIPAFDKCYKQLLQRTPGVVGEVVMSFTIEKTGKVISAEANTSNIADADFKRCLSEAIRRVEFKSFRGDPIVSTFPMTFE